MKLLLLILMICTTLKLSAKECQPHDYCIVSFYEVLPDPNKFEGAILGIVGVARRIDDQWFLFPNPDSANFALFEQSIHFDYKGAELNDDIVDGDFIYVYGGFTAIYSGLQADVRGSINREVKFSKMR